MNKINVGCPACEAPLDVKSDMSKIEAGVYEVSCPACGYEGLIELERVADEEVDRPVGPRRLKDLGPEEAKARLKVIIPIVAVLVIAAFVFHFIQG